MARSSEEVREELRRRGKTVPQLAKEIGFPLRNVRAVLYGHCKGHRGQAHQIAVALGMKEDPE